LCSTTAQERLSNSIAAEGAAMDESIEAEFIIDQEDDTSDYPVGQLTGWELVVFELDDEPETPW
jgi:hypothetical protein